MTSEQIREACDALLCGRTFKTITSLDQVVETLNFRMFVNDWPIARLSNNELFISVYCARNSTTVALLNGLPNVNITCHCRDYQLNGQEWDGRWFSVMSDVYKTKDDL